MRKKYWTLPYSCNEVMLKGKSMLLLTQLGVFDVDTNII